MPLYSITNSTTNSTRLTDISITKDQNNLAVSLESLTLILELQTPNVWKLTLNYSARENNSVKVYQDVLNSINDTLALSLETDSWNLNLDYTSASANPDLVFTVGSTPTPLTPTKLTLYLDKTMLHPRITTEFWLN